MNDIREIMANAFICADYRCYEGLDYVNECMVEVIEKLKLEGFVIVPKEANDDILNRMKAKNYLDVQFIKAIYKIIIKAAQGGDV